MELNQEVERIGLNQENQPVHCGAVWPPQSDDQEPQWPPARWSRPGPLAL